MQILTSMSVLRHHDTPPDLLALLFQLVPEGRFRATPNDKESFKLDLPEPDPRVNSVLQLLQERGFKQAELPDARQRLYRLVRRRTYDASDLAAAPFCWLAYCEVKGSTDGERTDKGLLRLAHADVQNWDEVTKIGPSLVIPDSFKRELEQARYKGLVFRPTVQTKPSRDHRSRKGAASPNPNPDEPVVTTPPEDAWWEVASETRIGPMHDVRRLALTGRQEPLSPNVQGPGVLVNEETYNDFRPVYSRSAINAVGTKDIVHTWEFVFRAEDPEMLVSPRLRAAFHAVQPACTWIPVEVVDD